MQSSNNKILKGFFTNIGADPFINWINEVFKTANRIYCSSIYYVTDNHADGVRNEWKYRVTKADNKSLLFYDAYSHTKPIIINISDVPELLNIRPNNIFIYCTNNHKSKTIKFLFGEFIEKRDDTYTYINNVLLTIDKKTGAVIDKEIISKFLIDFLPF